MSGISYYVQFICFESFAWPSDPSKFSLIFVYSALKYWAAWKLLMICHQQLQTHCWDMNVYLVNIRFCIELDSTRTVRSLSTNGLMKVTPTFQIQLILIACHDYHNVIPVRYRGLCERRGIHVQGHVLEDWCTCEAIAPSEGDASTLWYCIQGAMERERGSLSKSKENTLPVLSYPDATSKSKVKKLRRRLPANHRISKNLYFWAWSCSLPVIEKAQIIKAHTNTFSKLLAQVPAKLLALLWLFREADQYQFSYRFLQSPSGSSHHH